MQGIKEIGSYKAPESVGFTEWIKTATGFYFVKLTGEIVGPFGEKFPDDE